MSTPSSRRRSVILVTGAPRSGTTPVGNTIAQAAGAESIYEPWGPTGDVRFDVRFPIPGTAGFEKSELGRFVDDLAALSLTLKPQVRAGHKKLPFSQQLVRRVLGTRTAHSLRMARLKWGLSHVVWKDPYAVLAVPDILEVDVPVVVTLRPALAQAASYKRLNWQPNLGAIYPRFKQRYGADADIDRILSSPDEPPKYLAAAILWRMAYTAVSKGIGHPGLHIMSSTSLEHDEVGAYEGLFCGLSLPFESAKRYVEKRNAGSMNQKREATAVHDWNRSVSHTNSYWRSVLTDDEAERVRDLNATLEDTVSAASVGARPS